jgi:hypothetical protein
LSFTATGKTPRRFGVKREVDCEPSMRKGAPGGGRPVFLEDYANANQQQ